ncbi:MAG: type II toxin-antitoxin system Phd/YefM family antitoxin [Acidobacteria bacterium]|nr:type II toxin-antitoxin system Phd/YefM family antitoxin [Acidobacteriota bacterium]
MEEIAISKFKAKCLAILERVRRTNEPIRVTRFGKPVAEIVPPSLENRPPRRLGTLSDLITIHGDIDSPIGDINDWEAAREGIPWDPAEGDKSKE